MENLHFPCLSALERCLKQLLSFVSFNAKSEAAEEAKLLEQF